MDPARVDVKALDVGRTPLVFINIAPLAASFYSRGSQAQSPTSEFLFEESLRFFNFGASPKTSTNKGEQFIVKTFPRLTFATLSSALDEFCKAHTQNLYSHVAATYASLSPQNAKQFFGSVASDRYLLAALREKRLKAIFVPHLAFGLFDGVGAQKTILQWPTILQCGFDVCRTILDFHSGIDWVMKGIDTDVLRNLNATPLGTMVSDKWVGNSYATTFPTANDASYIAEFIGSKEQASIGLTEKIYSTLVLIGSTSAFRDQRMVFDETKKQFTDVRTLPFRPTSETREQANRFMKEFLKIVVDANGKRQGAISQIENWLGAIDATEEMLGFFFARVPDLYFVHSHVDGRGVVQTDLIWGFVLCAYLRLHILRAAILGLIAAIPFRQIYDGGQIWPEQSTDSVNGVVGIIAVALWEYFTGTSTSHPFTSSARTCAPPKSGWNKESQWVDPLTPLRAPDWLKQLLRSPDSITRLQKSIGAAATGESLVKCNVSVDFKSHFASEETEKIFKLVQLPNGPIGDKPTPFQRYAGTNYRRVLPRRPKQKDSERKAEFDKWLTAFETFPPTGSFPIPVESNPPILDDFFVGEPRLWVFNKWSVDSDSALSYAIKLACQLQMYVAGWLYRQFFLYARQKVTRLTELTNGSEVKFTAGSIQYGGKHPPHVSHRDGYGADWGLYGKTNPLWNASVQWPMDDDGIGEGKEKRTYSQVLMNEVEPFTTKIQLIRQSWAKVLLEKGITDQERTARRNAINDWIRDSVPVSRLDLDNDSNYPLSSISLRVLIAQYRDSHNKRSASASLQGGGSHYVFWEYLRNAIYGDVKNTEQKVRTNNPPQTSADWEEYFNGLENEYVDWPMFPGGLVEAPDKSTKFVPDPTAHWTYHIGHLAIFLSMPMEILCGGPIYHLRAIRAAVLAFLDTPYQPFQRAPRRDNDNQQDRTADPGRIGFGWPLPIPRLHFLPYDHYNHWHLNYWRTRTEDLPGDILASLSRETRQHWALVSACLPLWIMLGVDLSPFRRYLGMYLEAASSAKGCSEVRKDVAELLFLVSEYYESLKKQFPRTVLDGAAGLRQHMMDIIIGRLEDPDNLTTWPRPGSLLDDAIRDTEKIKSSVDRLRTQITDKSLPADIVEAMKASPEERKVKLESQDDALIRDVDGKIPVEIHGTEFDGSSREQPEPAGQKQ